MDTALEEAIAKGVKGKAKDGKEKKGVDEMEALAEDVLSAIEKKDKKKLARALRAARGI